MDPLARFLLLGLSIDRVGWPHSRHHWFRKNWEDGGPARRGIRNESPHLFAQATRRGNGNSLSPKRHHQPALSAHAPNRTLGERKATCMDETDRVFAQHKSGPVDR